MTAHAGQWWSWFANTAGDAEPQIDVTLLESDGVTPATIYADRTRSATVSNPLPRSVAMGQAGIDAEGNVNLWADPGIYRLVVVARDGSGAWASPVVVPVDPADTGGGGADQTPWTSDIDAAGFSLSGLHSLTFANGTTLVERGAGGARVRDDTSLSDGNALLQTLWTDGSDLADTSWSSRRVGPTIADDKTGEFYMEALDAATGHYPFLDMGAQAGPSSLFAFLELSDWNSGFAHLQLLHDAAAGLNEIRSDHFRVLESPSNLLAFFGATPTVGQHAAIADVPVGGTINDVRTALNTLLGYCRALGLVAP